MRHRIDFNSRSSLLLTIPMPLLCFGSLLPVFEVIVCATFHIMYPNIILVRFRLLSGHLFGKRYSLVVLIVFLLFVNLVIFQYGFEF